jgi:hypothetical protein
MLTTKFENNYAYYEIKDFYLKITCKKAKYIDYRAARVLVSDRLRIQSYKAYHIICDISLIEGISLDARDYLATSGSLLIKSAALVSTRSTLKHFATYFIAINNPKAPTKVFDSIQDAEQYIQSQL